MTPERPTCPRCDSSSTKFCYYNNYNLSQPRYFCKTCRRYWTLGGSLRNIPAGGTSRKNNAAAATSTSSSSSSSTHPSKRRRSRPSFPSAASSISPLSPASPVSDVPNADDGADGRMITDASMTDMSGTFAAVLAEPLPSGFLALGDPFLHGRTGTGFDLDVGLGLGGMQEIGIELEKSASALAWPFSSDDGGEVVSDIGDAWKATGEDPPRVEDDGGRIGWTDLAISTPGKSVQ